MTGTVPDWAHPGTKVAIRSFHQSRPHIRPATITTTTPTSITV